MLQRVSYCSRLSRVHGGAGQASAVPRRLALSGRRRTVYVTAAGTLMIVESPTKATKIQKYLGDQYQVLASYGHIRELPNMSGSVLPEDNFKMIWQLMPQSLPRYQAIKNAARNASKVVFATDPDREGEAIAWHVMEELQAAGLLRGRAVQRVTFTDITQAAVTNALQHPRQVSTPLVEAYLARRALDYLVGFNISPLLWTRLPGAKSAGRVQSVALRVCCEREQQIAAFNPQEYCSVTADVRLADGTELTAQVVEVDGKALKKMDLSTKQQAQQLVQRLQAQQLQALNISSKQVSRQPPPPFTTSSLQQAAASKLGFSVAQTMRLAQQLYEGSSHQGEGLISYMRTDSVQMCPEAVTAVRQAATQLFGANTVPAQPRVYKSRAKNSQEAHEAIRPTHPELHPSKLPSSIDASQRKLYALIWSRATASQMCDASIQQVSLELGGGGVKLRSSASHVTVPGFMQAYQWAELGKQGSSADEAAAFLEEDVQQDDPQDSAPATAAKPQLKPNAASLLKLKAGQPLQLLQVSSTQHSTQPPGRYSEASLVKTMEEMGIGRPSTYAAIISLLQQRGYIVKEGRSLVPTPRGQDLTAFLARWLTDLVDFDFTSNMESQLDQVAAGSTEWRALLDEFWQELRTTCGGLKDVRTQHVYDYLDQVLEKFEFPDPADRVCPSCGSGRLQRKPSKYGSFIGCTNYDNPDIQCKFQRPLRSAHRDRSTDSTGPSDDASSPDKNASTFNSPFVPRELGNHPSTGLAVSVRLGPYGPYVQMEPPPAASAGKKTKKQAAPRRASLPMGMNAANVTMEDAVALLLLPRELGLHPDDAQPVMVNQGRFGPYVQHGDLRAGLGKTDPSVTVANITLPQALELLARQASRPARRGLRAKTNAGKASSEGSATTIKRHSGKSKAASAADAVVDSAASVSSGKGSRARVKSDAGATGSAAPAAGSYQEFMRIKFKELKAQHSDAKAPEIMKMVAAAWRLQETAAAV